MVKWPMIHLHAFVDDQFPHFFFSQTEKSTALSKITELESALSESNTLVSNLRTSVSDSNSKIRELEATLFARQEEHSGDASIREQQLRENSERISALAKDIEEHAKIKTGLDSEIKILVSVAFVSSYKLSYAQYSVICFKTVWLDLCINVPK